MLSPPTGLKELWVARSQVHTQERHFFIAFANIREKVFELVRALQVRSVQANDSVRGIAASGQNNGKSICRSPRIKQETPRQWATSNCRGYGTTKRYGKSSNSNERMRIAAPPSRTLRFRGPAFLKGQPDRWIPKRRAKIMTPMNPFRYKKRSGLNRRRAGQDFSWRRRNIRNDASMNLSRIYGQRWYVKYTHTAPLSTSADPSNARDERVDGSSRW